MSTLGAEKSATFLNDNTSFIEKFKKQIGVIKSDGTFSRAGESTLEENENSFEGSVVTTNNLKSVSQKKKKKKRSSKFVEINEGTSTETLNQEISSIPSEKSDVRFLKRKRITIEDFKKRIDEPSPSPKKRLKKLMKTTPKKKKKKKKKRGVLLKSPEPGNSISEQTQQTSPEINNEEKKDNGFLPAIKKKNSIDQENGNGMIIKKKGKKDKKGQKYKPYTFKDFKIMKEKSKVRLGGLGADLENEKYIEKRNYFLKKQKYGKMIEEINRNKWKHNQRKKRSSSKPNLENAKD